MEKVYVISVIAEVSTSNTNTTTEIGKRTCAMDVEFTLSAMAVATTENGGTMSVIVPSLHFGSNIVDVRQVRCGRGRYCCADGSTYDGEWANNMRQGNGCLRLRNGFRYEGTWKDNQMEGRGWCQYPEGSKYEGMWRSGRKDGRGTLSFPNGAYYEGRFRDDKVDGTGTFTMPRTVVAVNRRDWVAMIPIEFQSDVHRVHLKAGFDIEGL